MGCASVGGRVTVALMNATNAQTITVLASAVPTIEAKIAKLNRFAENHGVGKASVEVVRTFVETSKDEFGFIISTEFAEIILNVPAVNGREGWSLVGVIDHGENGNIIGFVPSFEGTVPEEFRTSSQHRCDECNTRRDRAKTILVRNGDEFRQVGGDCVSAVLGIPFASALWVAEMSDRILDDESFFNGRGESPSLLHFVSVSAMIIEVMGFVPRSSGDTPTSDIATWVIDGNVGSLRRMAPQLLEFLAAAQADPEGSPQAAKIARANDLAVKAIEWARGIEAKSDFEHNLKILAARNEVGKQAGLAAFIAEAYRRHMADVETKAAAEALPESRFVGVVGSKVVLTGCRVVYTHRSAGYAYSSPDAIFVVLIAADGTKATLSTNVGTAVGHALDNATSSDRFDIAATVKEHKIYRGGSTTVLTRAKIVGQSIVEDAA